MTRQTANRILAVIFGMSFVTLAAYLAFEDVARDPVIPSDVNGLARWIGAHPADWLAASALTDRALDSPLERRVDVWRRAHALASRLAPLQPNAGAAFVRSGLFHWYELEEADRRRVLDASKPLLRDPDTFRELATPLWLLTRDLAFLRGTNPGTVQALSQLRDLAITHGSFEDYRELREEVRRARFAEFGANPVVTSLYHQLPRPIDAADEPLIRRVLQSLKAKPLESLHDSAPLIEYVLDHRLTPVEGLAPAVHFADLRPELRARLARALGMEVTAREIEVRHGVLPAPEPPLGQWTGTCGTNEVCTSAFRSVRGGGTATIRIRNVQSDEVAPYVEIYLDDALRAEGAVRDDATFAIRLGDEGLHEIEVRLANPFTRNRIQRRVALSWGHI